MVERDPSGFWTTFGAMNGGSNAPLVVISGAAGTGKTTLARACARAWSAPVADLDDVAVEETRQAIASDVDPTEALAAIRHLRYRQLRDLVCDLRLSGAPVVVAVAPFTREVSSVENWEAFVEQVGGGSVSLVWVRLDPAERLRRIDQRGAERDRNRGDLQADFSPPPVPHLAIDGASDLPQSIERIRSRFDNGTL